MTQKDFYKQILKVILQKCKITHIVMVILGKKNYNLLFC